MKKIFRSPVATVALFLVAAALLAVGTIGGIRAALLVNSNSYLASMELADRAQVALVENDAVTDGTLLADLAAEEAFCIGKTYDESLAVTNTGAIDVYVRVTVYRYWTDADGKAVELDPSLIILGFSEDGWTVDEDASTPERTVLYYASPLAPGETTSPFAETLTIDSRVASAVNADSHEYSYDDVTFNVEAVADGVQTHDGEAAMLSAWGRTN